jgi:tRNA 2-thiouridine synthesizing protein A
VTDEPDANAEWNAGELGCGDLVLQLRMKVMAMAPGAILKLTALDQAAPEDIPSWCGLTRHTLVKASHPIYWIKRRTED